MQRLSKNEFVRVPPGEVDDPEEKAEDERYFKELVFHFKPFLPPYLVGVADSNHDGELSEKEMITNYRLFTGSSMASNPKILHEEF